jgi:ribosome-associated translation inhibitor RaiA
MAINFHIKTTNIDLTPDVSSQVHEKLSVIEKYLSVEGDKQVLAEVEIGLISKHHKKGDVYRGEINVSSGGNLYRAVAKRTSVSEVVDELKDEIGKVIKRKTTKRDSLFKKGGRLFKKMLRRDN